MHVHQTLANRTEAMPGAVNESDYLRSVWVPLMKEKLERSVISVVSNKNELAKELQKYCLQYFATDECSYEVGVYLLEGVTWTTIVVRNATALIIQHNHDVEHENILSCVGAYFKNVWAIARESNSVTNGSGNNALVAVQSAEIAYKHFIIGETVFFDDCTTFKNIMDETTRMDTTLLPAHQEVAPIQQLPMESNFSGPVKQPTTQEIQEVITIKDDECEFVMELPASKRSKGTKHLTPKKVVKVLRNVLRRVSSKKKSRTTGKTRTRIDKVWLPEEESKFLKYLVQEKPQELRNMRGGTKIYQIFFHKFWRDCTYTLNKTRSPQAYHKRAKLLSEMSSSQLQSKHELSSDEARLFIEAMT